MVPSNGNPSSITWFTEGEFVWRTGASIAWIIICLPLVIFSFCMVQLLDVFHPISWISGIIGVPFRGSFWLAVFACGITAIVTSLSRAKFNSVKDVINKTRIAAILFPLHPTRILHITLFTMSGMLILWSLASFSTQPQGLSIYNKESNTYHLNEHLVFLMLYGAWLGFYHSLLYFYEKKFHYEFPEIQEKKFFRAKFSVVPCIREAVVTCLRVCLWYYPLYYFAGDIPRDCVANILGLPLNGNATKLNSISGLLSLPLLWFLLTSGTLVNFMWDFGNKLFVIFNTQTFTFSIETALAAEKDKCLPEVIKNRTVPLLKYLAFLDLFQLSQFNSRRRKQIFSLSQPGGRPVNWSNISEECLFVVDFLTTNLTEELAKKAQWQQLKQEPAFFSPKRNGESSARKDQNFPQTTVPSSTIQSPYQLSGCANTTYTAGQSGTSNMTSVSSPAGYSGIANGTYTSPTVGYSVVTRRQVTTPMVQLWTASPGRQLNTAPSPVQPVTHRQRILAKLDPYVWRVQQIPHNIAVTLKRRPIIGFLFNEISQASTQMLFADCQLQIWAVEALSRLVAASYREDTFGVVQKTLPDVLASLLALLMALDRHFKFPVSNPGKPVIQSRPPRPQGKDGMPYALRAALVSSIFRITTTFKDHLSLVKLEPEHRNRLQSFMDFME